MDIKEIQELLGGGKVEVVEDGKQVANPRIDPAPMSFLMQAAQLGQLVKIRKYFQDRTPNGLIQRFNPLVTDQPTEIKVDYPAQSFSLHNDGPDTVTVWVITRLRPEATVNQFETMNVSYETHVIKHFYLQCAPTQTAAVRIVAKD